MAAVEKGAPPNFDCQLEIQSQSNFTFKLTVNIKCENVRPMRWSFLLIGAL